MARQPRLIESTPFPDVPMSLPIPQLSESQLLSLGETVMILIDVNLGNRRPLDVALDTWNAMYEMRTKPRDVPWPNSANICLPIINAGVNEFVSRVAGTVLIKRPLTVTGNDPVATQYSHLVEEYLNAEYARNDWEDAFKTCIHLAARDGTSIAEVMWDLSTHEETRFVEDLSQPPDIAASMDATAGMVRKPPPPMKKQKLTFVDYDAPRITPVELRDFILIPNFAPSIAAADAVIRKVYMNEWDFMKMVNAGIFDAKIAEQILSYVDSGMGELSKDRQLARTYSISGRLAIVDFGVAPPEDIKMTRGPVEMWRYHTNQFDLDGDGVPEENLIWVHDSSRLCPGAVPFQYWRGRPFFPCVPIERPNRFYGFSVPELLRGIQEEANAQHISRLDWLDMSGQPMRYKTRGVRFRDEDRRWGPDAEVEVEKPDDFGFVQMPQVPPDSLNEEQFLLQYADRVLGAPQSATLQMPSSSGRVSSRQAQYMAAMQQMQSNMVMARMRKWMLDVFEYARSLYMQYGYDQLETVASNEQGSAPLAIPRDVLSMNYTLAIIGQSGPFDKEQRRNDSLLLAQFAMPLPFVQADMQRQWNIARMVFENYDIPEVTAFIGTMQDAQQQQQQMAQAAQQQQQQALLAQIISHANMGKAKLPGMGGGQPGQPSQRGQSNGRTAPPPQLNTLGA